MPKTMNATDTANLARNELKRKHSLFGSWRAVEEDLGINRGELCAVANGKRNVTARIYRTLNMPEPVIIHAHICPLCGETPTPRHRCKNAAKRPRRTYDISYKRLRELLQNPYLKDS